MSPSQSIIGLPYAIVIECVISTNPFKAIVALRERPGCAHCASLRVWIKDRYLRAVRHITLGERWSTLFLRGYKMHCQDCGRYSHTRFPAVLPKLRATEPFRKEVFKKHHGGIPQSHLSKELGLGAATIERWYHDFLNFLLAETKDKVCPKILGIDEHFFSRQKGYATTFVDLAKRKVFDIALGRSEKSLDSFLRSLKGRDRVQLVVMDLSETYRSIVRKYFPNALIVADRFHVIRLINHAFLKAWAQLDPVGRKNRGLLSLMRRHQKNLAPNQEKNLQAYLKHHPTLASIYEFKQKLCNLMLQKHLTARLCRKHIPTLLNSITQLLDCPMEVLQTLGKSLKSWLHEIARMWRFTRTNSITEGLHNKMEVISRRAYGFRNFTNYRLRVLVLCGYCSKV